MALHATTMNAGRRIRRALTFTLYTWLSAIAVACTSLAIIISSAASGPYSMDVTFDLSPTSPRFSQTKIGRMSVDQSIRCTDETEVFNDGVAWVRCRFIANEIMVARRHLQQLGMQTGSTFRNVRITPINGGYGFYFASALVAIILVFMLIQKCGWNLRIEFQILRKLGWRTLPILLAPTAISMTLASLIYLTLGDATKHSVTPALSTTEQISLVIAAILIAPLVEELLHRGLVFHLLTRVGSRVSACIVGTALFVVCHLAAEFWDAGHLRLLMLVVMSTCLYAIRARFGSITLCIGAHALANTLVLLAWQHAMAKLS